MGIAAGLSHTAVRTESRGTPVLVRPSFPSSCNPASRPALDATARHCLGWDEATRHDPAEKLKALPPLHSSQESYHGELIFTEWMERINQLKEPQRTERLKEVFNMAGDDAKGAAAEKQRFAALMVPETLRQEIAANRELFPRALAAFGKPWKEGKAELDAIDKEIQQSKFTLVKMVMPVSARCYDKGFVVATLRTMLDAALEHGAQLDEARAATYRDAFEGNPLRLQKSANGALSLVAAEPHPKGKEIHLKLGR